MQETISFGNPQIADTIAEKFGDGKEIKIEMRYTSQVLGIIKDIEQAHADAAHSKLTFR